MIISVDRIQGLSGDVAIKAPCRAATTSNITLSGLQTVDGVVLASGNRVLVKSQTAPNENGIYNADTSTWQRALDFNGVNDVTEGTIVTVSEGTVNAGRLFTLISTAPVTPGSASLTFAQALASFVDLVPNVRLHGAVGGDLVADHAAFVAAQAAHQFVYVPESPAPYLVNAGLDYWKFYGPGIVLESGANARQWDLDGEPQTDFGVLKHYRQQVWGNYESACAASIGIAIPGNGQTRSNAQVLGQTEGADIRVSAERPAVALNIVNYSHVPYELTGATVFTATSVQHAGIATLITAGSLKRGMFVDVAMATDRGSSTHTGHIQNWSGTTITVDAWWMTPNPSPTSGTPANGTAIMINAVNKIWGQNTNVRPMDDHTATAGYEMGLLASNQAQADGVWGFDAVSLTTFRAQANFIARGFANNHFIAASGWSAGSGYGANYSFVAEAPGITGFEVRQPFETPPAGDSFAVWVDRQFDVGNLRTANGTKRWSVEGNGLVQNDFRVIEQGTVVSSVVTIAGANITYAGADSFALHDPVFFTTTGGLPTGLSVGALYYIVGVDPTGAGGFFVVAATPYGTQITTSGVQSGVHTVHKTIGIRSNILLNSVDSAVQTLPSAAGNLGRVYTVVAFAQCSIVAFGAEQIDGLAVGVFIPKGTVLSVISDNANWFLLTDGTVDTSVFVNATTSPYAVSLHDSFINYTGGGTVNLPSPVGLLGRTVTIRAGTVFTLATPFAGAIEQPGGGLAATLAVAINTTVAVISDNGNWRIKYTTGIAPTPTFAAVLLADIGNGATTGTGNGGSLDLINAGGAGADWSAVFNVGGGFADSGATDGKFTAPSDGNYYFHGCVTATGITAAMTDARLSLYGSFAGNRIIARENAANTAVAGGTLTLQGDAIIPMLAGQTAFLNIAVYNGVADSAVVKADFASTLATRFEGHKIA